LVLVLALLRGILYLALLPPWQHYDEPTHFEYVRLIAERLRLPQPGDYDLEMRREIAASMKAHGFYRELGEPTIDLWSDEPPGIGIAELKHPPLYYTMVALPQFLAMAQDVETQLYLARLVSVGLYVLVVAATYGMLKDLLNGRRWLPLVVATFVAFLPPLTDLMSAVNNDVGAIAAVTLLLWASVRLLRDGFSIRRALAGLFLAGACFLTKSTASVAAIVILLVLAASYVPRSLRRWLPPAAVILMVASLPIVFTVGEHAAAWYSLAPEAGPNRVQTLTPLGKWALGLSTKGTPNTSTVLQEVVQSQSVDLQGKPVTFGLWLRTDQELAQPVVLSLRSEGWRKTHSVEASESWQFHAVDATLDPDASGLAVAVAAPSGGAGGIMIYADGLVLAEGQRPTDNAPAFDGAMAERGSWGGREFENLLRNGSAERSWPGMRNWIGDKEIYRQSMAMVLHSVLDWSRTEWVYWVEFLLLHDSFWGRFSWGHLILPQPILVFLLLVTLSSAAGCFALLVRRQRAGLRLEEWERSAWVLMGAVFLVSWGTAILRIHPVFLTFNFRWPMARYAAVAIVPTATFLCLGWRALLPARWRGWAAVGGLMGLVTLDAVAILMVLVPFYYG
jgi:hypothetical protein